MTPFVHVHKIPRTSLPTIVGAPSALLSYLHTQMRLSASKTSLWRLGGELISTSHGDDEVGKSSAPMRASCHTASEECRNPGRFYSSATGPDSGGIQIALQRRR